MSDTANNKFPETARQPGFLSIWDAETFRQAGLEPLNALKERFRTYEAVVAEGRAQRARLDGVQWNAVLVKASIGGLITLAKQMTKGAKASVAKDFGLSEDTANRYERLYKYMPWAWQWIREQAAISERAGRDHQYSIDAIIAEGERQAIAAGATVFRPKFTGTGRCLLVDPTTQTKEITDLPASFSASKGQRVHWTEVEGVTLAAGVRVWQPVDKQGSSSNLKFLKIGDHGLKVQRLVIARITKKNEVMELGDTSQLQEIIDFDAREPKQTDVLSVDPSQGTNGCPIRTTCCVV